MTSRSHVSLDDQATRALAQDEFTRPLIVEAGAGTGKTALLVARVAAWCVGAGWNRHTGDADEPSAVARRVIEGVVAITFTEAAAAEMATRIGAALAGLARRESPIGWVPGRTLAEIDIAEITTRASALGGEIHRLSVTTIHAYCQRVLAAHPFEADLHPQFEIDADGSAIESLVDDVVEDALRGLEDDPHREAWEQLAARFVGPAMVAEALRCLIGAGVQPNDLQHDPFDRSAAAGFSAELEAALSGFFDAEAGLLVKVPRNQITEDTRAALALVAERLSALESQTGFEVLQETLVGLGNKQLKRLRDWSKGTFTKGEAKALDDVADGLIGPAGRLAESLDSLIATDLEGFRAARELLFDLMGEVDRRRSTRGIVTFSDLLQETARLFEGNDEICGAERRRTEQLLVDEFQDTDDVQCRIVDRLALHGDEDERPGLFIVGDPKQSIYAWRSADLAAYDEFVDRVLDRGGVLGPLTRNFRSVQPILDEVERVVAPVMHRELGIQPAFEALEATDERRRSPGFEHLPWSAVEHWVCWHVNSDGVLWSSKQKTAEIVALEARAIAADIRNLHNEAGVRYGDVAVLLRATTAQGELLEAFREAGVPFDVAREREYFHQREIIEAAALVRAVLEPTDTLALLTVIRSDAVGVPDVALAPLWDAGFPSAAAELDGSGEGEVELLRSVISKAVSSMEATPGSEAVPGWPDALAGAVESLAELRRSLHEDPPDFFVERLRTLWLAEVSAGARHLGRFRQARLDGFFADLERILTRSSGASAELARFLRRAVEEGREAPTVSEPDRDADAVHVMTIYGAKGLDFEHVYLAQIHKKTGGFGTAAAVVRRLDDRAELSLFGWSSPAFVRAERLRERQTRAERVRLLYVAMTRAKQRLVVSGGWAEPGELVEATEADTLAKLIAHRGDPEHLVNLIERGVDREAGADPCVGWYLPALSEDEPAPQVGRKSAVSISDGDAAARDAGLITEARNAAGHRMAARWTEAASGAAHRLSRRMETEIDGETATGKTLSTPGVAAIVGTAIHHLLESLDLTGDLAEQVLARRESSVEAAVAGLDPDTAVDAIARLEEMMDHLVQSECLRRLAELAPAIVARELPVFLRPTEMNGTSVISGAVDLVYRDPGDGRIVIADYKTDRVEGDAGIAGRVERYRPQLETYAQALEQALDLDEPPHTELWFLHPDRIVRLT